MYYLLNILFSNNLTPVSFSRSFDPQIIVGITIPSLPFTNIASTLQSFLKESCIFLPFETFASPLLLFLNLHSAPPSNTYKYSHFSIIYISSSFNFIFNLPNPSHPNRPTSSSTIYLFFNNLFSLKTYQTHIQAITIIISSCTFPNCLSSRSATSKSLDFTPFSYIRFSYLFDHFIHKSSKQPRPHFAYLLHQKYSPTFLSTLTDTLHPSFKAFHNFKKL